jgi:hypothetical protein
VLPANAIAVHDVEGFTGDLRDTTKCLPYESLMSRR